MYTEATTLLVWDVTEHMFAVAAAGKHTDLYKYGLVYRLKYKCPTGGADCTKQSIIMIVGFILSESLKRQCCE